MAFIISGAVVNGLFSSNSSRQAANTQADSARAAQQTQLDMFNKTNDQQAPWRQAGQTALGQLGAGTADGGQFSHQFNAGDLKSNLAPNYDWQLGQGLGAVNNQASMTGGLVGGNALKGINDYAQNFAGNSYQNAFNNYNTNQSNIFNRLSSIAGLGQTANGQMSTFSQHASDGISSSQAAVGAAQGAGYMGQAKAFGNAINGVAAGGNSWYNNNQQTANNAISNINPFSSANQYYGTTGTDANGYTTSSNGAYTG